MSAATGPLSEERTLAFLDLAVFEDGAALRGGCLVTDGMTRPLEFRVSGPIRPSSLQKVLYGDTLQEYICTDLIGLPMLQGLETKPDIILVRDAEFLKLRPKTELAALWVRATVDGQPEPGGAPSRRRVGCVGQRLVNPSPRNGTKTIASCGRCARGLQPEWPSRKPCWRPSPLRGASARRRGRGG